MSEIKWVKKEDEKVAIEIKILEWLGTIVICILGGFGLYHLVHLFD
jgi:hypothetical protein